MEATVITRALGSDTTTLPGPDRSATADQFGPSELESRRRSVLLLRSAIASMVLTLILLPGGFRALLQTGMGWEAWSFARFLIVLVILCHFVCCWIPLAVRYFRRGECRDVPAFLIATASLFVQALIGYGLFAYYYLWNGGAT